MNTMTLLNLEQFDNITKQDQNTLDLVIANFSCIGMKEFNLLVGEDLYHPALQM